MMAKKKKKDEVVLRSELEEALRARGFHQSLNKTTNVVRTAYVHGSTRVLLSTLQAPWCTVQRVSGGTVDWFVDFPIGVPITNILAFLNSFEKGTAPSIHEFQTLEKRSVRLASLMERCHQVLFRVQAGIWKTELPAVVQATTAGEPAETSGITCREHVVPMVEDVMLRIAAYVNGKPEPPEPDAKTAKQIMDAANESNAAISA
jgi:hypothetical protein